MNNGKRLDQLTKEELIEKVKKGREYYLKLTEIRWKRSRTKMRALESVRKMTHSPNL